MLTQRPRHLTWKVRLPGGQDRLKEAVLYVAKACQEAEYFGLIKLNKILWRADFRAYAERKQPVTGRPYQRLRLGPAPVEMVIVLDELQASQFLRIEKRPIFGFDEQRPVPLAEPDLKFFSPDDLKYIDEAVGYYWKMTGTITSEESHGIAWRTHDLSDLLPYESAFLSDEPVSESQGQRMLALAAQKGWNSR